MSAASGSIATTDLKLESMTDGCDDSGPANIVGAGVAGLSVALALRQHGLPVRVLEQAPAITEVGAGLQISPNGTRVLRALGLDPAGIGDPARAVILHDARGRPLLHMPLPMPSAEAPGFFLAHRADLIAALERAARAEGAEIRLLQHLETASSAADCVDLSFANGARSGAGLVIGADGLHSALRPVLNGAATPFFTGQVAWRALIPGDGHSDGRVQVFMGPGRHLVSYPLRGGALRNLVAVEERSVWAAESWSQTDDPAALQTAFAGFGGPVPGWLEAVEVVNLWGLFRHPVAARWTDRQGRLAILGDAAHPTLPFLAQGANLALEDAWELAGALVAHDRIAALSTWEARRRKRVTSVIAAANRNAVLWHLRPPLAALAHLGLWLGGRIAPRAALLPFRPVHGYDATRFAPPPPVTCD